MGTRTLLLEKQKPCRCNVPFVTPIISCLVCVGWSDEGTGRRPCNDTLLNGGPEASNNNHEFHEEPKARCISWLLLLSVQPFSVHLFPSCTWPLAKWNTKNILFLETLIIFSISFSRTRKDEQKSVSSSWHRGARWAHGRTSFLSFICGLEVRPFTMPRVRNVETTFGRALRAFQRFFNDQRYKNNYSFPAQK